MIVTKIVDLNGNTCAVHPDGAVHKKATHYVDFAEADDAAMVDGQLVVNGETKLAEVVSNAETLFFFTWYSLTEEQQKKLGCPVWVYGEASQRWHPQMALKE